MKEVKPLKVKSIEEEGFKLWWIGDYAFAYAPHIIITLIILYVILDILVNVTK